MPGVVNCPSCERRLSVPETLVGEWVKCPTCGETFTADPDGPPPRPEQDEEPRPPGRDTRLPRPSRDDKDDEAPRPRPVRAPRRDEDEYDDRPRRRPRREKPGKVQALGVMMLVGGILGLVCFLALGVGSTGVCCVWPGTYYSLVMGILALIKGCQLLGDDAHRQLPPRGIAVMMLINILNLDVTNLALGIVCLVFLKEPEVERYFRG